MIIDAHCDVLWKLLNDSSLDFYKDEQDLQLNYPNMLKGDISLQIFAIFVSPTIKSSNYKIALQSIDDFYEKVYNQDKLILATSYQEIVHAQNQGKKVAMLSLEGADSIEGDLAKLRIFYRLGVRAMGLTWNYANAVADGVREERGAGLTNFGKKVIAEMNRLGMIIDVSHLSEAGFWDVMELTNTPIIASHSNAKAICDHPRNLTDEQIIAVIKNNGMIGVTFVNEFIKNESQVSIEDLLPHIEHIASLGGIQNLGIGSDFDGASPLSGLENASQMNHLKELLLKKFSEKEVEGILGENWLNYFQRVL